MSASNPLGTYWGAWGIAASVGVVGLFDVLGLVLHGHWAPKYRGLSRLWPRWPITFISNRRDDLPPGKEPAEWWAFDVLDPAHLVTSHCVPTWVLLLLHAFCFIYFIVYVLLDVCLYYPAPGPPENPYWAWLTYVTNWTITFYSVASLVAFADTARYMWLKRTAHKNPASPTGTAASLLKWDALSIAHALLMEVFTTASFFVAVWYWAGVVGVAKSEVDWYEATTYMPHGGSAVLAFLQVVLTRMPITSHHYPALMAYANAYLILLWVYGSTTGVWRYGLDWHYSRPAVVFMFLMPLLFIMFSLWYFTALLRDVVRHEVCCCPRRLDKRRHNAVAAEPATA